MHDLIANIGVILALVAGTSLWLYARHQEKSVR